jgi:hypothetical protein
MDRQTIKPPPGQALHPQVLLERVVLGGATETDLLADLARREEQARIWRETVRAKVRDGKPLSAEELGFVLYAIEVAA